MATFVRATPTKVVGHEMYSLTSCYSQQGSDWTKLNLFFQPAEVAELIKHST